MQWFRCDVNVIGHPKLDELAEALDGELDALPSEQLHALATLGVWLRLVCLTGERAPDGDLSRIADRQIVKALGWPRGVTPDSIARVLESLRGSRLLNGHEVVGWVERQTRAIRDQQGKKQRSGRDDDAPSPSTAGLAPLPRPDGRVTTDHEVVDNPRVARGQPAGSPRDGRTDGRTDSTSRTDGRTDGPRAHKDAPSPSTAGLAPLPRPDGEADRPAISLAPDRPTDQELVTLVWAEVQAVSDAKISERTARRMAAMLQDAAADPRRELRAFCALFETDRIRGPRAEKLLEKWIAKLRPEERRKPTQAERDAAAAKARVERDAAAEAGSLGAQPPGDPQARGAALLARRAAAGAPLPPEEVERRRRDQVARLEASEGTP